MIFYISTARHADTVGVLLSYYGTLLDDRMRVLPYARLDLLTAQAGDVVIWTDFDRLSSREARMAADMRKRLEASAPGILQLNHPTASLRRFDLLRNLHEAGFNRFNVYRFHEATPDIAFPAFIRKERGASRHAPVLLTSWPDLQAAMAAHTKRGDDIDDLMVVELCAQPGSDGKFRKYGLFRMGDAIFPQDCVVSDHWYIKYASRKRGADASRENDAYLSANPHAEDVRPLFQFANIEFGRMDYGIVDGRVQVFEINTNPTFVTQPPSRYDDFDRTARARHYQEAFLRLQTQALQRIGKDPETVSSTTPEVERAHAEVMRGVRDRADRRHRRRQVRGLFGAVGKPVRRILGGQR